MRAKLILTLALVAALALAGRAAAAVSTVQSSTWAGYVASKKGVRFKRVAAFWNVPTATCTPGQRTYSAVWVGLGGYHSRSTALEQLGTESDCRADGSAAYSSWYELVPSAAHSATLTVHPGDQMAASVLVSGRAVRLRMVDLTRGTSFVKHLRSRELDVTSADWIVESPSACNSEDRCHTLPLANFGAVGFALGTATASGGHEGTLRDPAWGLHALDLVADPQRSVGPGFAGPPQSGAGHGAGATPGALDAAGDAFAVTYG